MPTPDELLALADEADRVRAARARPVSAAAPRRQSIEDTIAEADAIRNRSALGDVGAGIDASNARAGAGIAQAWNRATHYAQDINDGFDRWLDGVFPGMDPGNGHAAERPPWEFSDQEVAGIRADASDVERQVGPGAIAGKVQGAADVARYFGGPIGMAGAAAAHGGNEYADLREQGIGEGEALARGGATALADYAAPGVAGRVVGPVAKRLGGRLVEAATRPAAGRIIGGVAEHGLTGAATGVALTEGAVGVDLAAGDQARAKVDQSQLLPNVIAGAGIGGLGGLASGTGLAVREHVRAQLEAKARAEEAQIRAGTAQAWDEGVARGAAVLPQMQADAASKAVAEQIAASLPQMAEQGVMAPPVEAFDTPARDAEIQAGGAAELERMQAERARTLQVRQISDDAQANQDTQALRQAHADDLARLGYPVQPVPDLMLERREARRQAVAEDAQNRLQAVQDEEAPPVDLTPPIAAEAPPAPPEAIPVEPPMAPARPSPLLVRNQRRAAFAADSESAIKVKELRASGLTVPEITQLIDAGQFAATVDRQRQARASQPPPAASAPAPRVGQFDEALAAQRRAEAQQRTVEAHTARRQALESEEAGAAPISEVRAGAPVSEPARQGQRPETVATLSPTVPAGPGPAPAAGGRLNLGQARQLLREQAARRMAARDESVRPSGAAPVSEMERPAPADAGSPDIVRPSQAPAPDEGPSAPRAAAPAEAAPLEVHRTLRGPQKVLDPARRPEPEPEPIAHEIDRETAINAIQPYKGNKRAAFTPVTGAVRATFGADAQKVTTIHDPFGGGGGYGLALGLSEFPNAKKLVVGELSKGRLDKIQFIHERGYELRKRAIETGVYDSIRKVWEQMKAEGHAGSGGGVAGRLSDRVIDEFYGPNGDGRKFAVQHGVDPAEAQAIMHAYIDAMQRGVKEDFDGLVSGAEEAALHGAIAAEAFRARGGEIEYRHGDAFAQEYPSGPETVMVVDPPYVGTTGYGEGRATVGDSGLYDKTVSSLEQARARKNGVVYTDEAWWAKGTNEKPALTASQGSANDPILDRAQQVADRWSFYPVGKRTESVAVTNGFRPESGHTSSRSVYDAERTAFRERQPVAPGDAPAAGRAKVEAPNFRAPEREGAVETRLGAEAEANLAGRKAKLTQQHERGAITRAQAEDTYAKEVERETARLRERLTPAERQANEVERATTARKSTLVPDAEGKRRAALKTAIGERKLPGEVVDHPLGVAVKMKNGTSILFMDAHIPEAEWNFENWKASVLASPGGGERYRAIMRKVTGGKAPRSKGDQLKMMREQPPVAGLLEANGRALAFDADFIVRAAKVVDSLISGGEGRAIDEEISQAMWRLMPEGDRQAILPELKKFTEAPLEGTSGADAEEAFHQWTQRKRSLLQAAPGEGAATTSLLGKAWRAIRSTLSKLLGTAQQQPLASKSVAERVYERVKGGDYFAGKPEAVAKPEAPGAAAPRAPDAPRERFSIEQDLRRGVGDQLREQGALDVQHDEDLRERVRARKEALGGIDAQRAEASRIMAEAREAGAGMNPEDIMLARSVFQHEISTALRTNSQAAAERLVAAATEQSFIANAAGRNLRAFREDVQFDLASAEGRNAYAQVHIRQLAGRQREQYRKAKGAFDRAIARGDHAAADRAKETMDRLAVKGAENHAKLRDKILRKYKVDLDSPDIGHIFADRYSVDRLLDTVASHRADWTWGDVLRTSFVQSVLPAWTVTKNITGNIPNTLWHTYARPTLEAAFGAAGIAKDGKSWDEVKEIYRGLMPALRFAWQNAKSSYFAGHDVAEDQAVGTRTGIGQEAMHSRAQAPSILQLLTGLDQSYISTRGHTMGDAFFKAWSGYSHVAAEAYKIARERGLSGSDVGDHIAETLHNGPLADASGAWERGYRRGKLATFQEANDAKLTPEWMLKAMHGISRAANVRLKGGFAVGGHDVDIQPFVWMLPFQGTPASIKRQAFSKSPFQVLKIVSRLANRGYDGEGHATLAGDLSELTAGAIMLGALYGMVSPDDDKTRITGSEADWKSAEGRMERRDGTPPPHSIKMFGSWWDYSAGGAFAEVAMPMVDAMRGIKSGHTGAGLARAASGLRKTWLLQQLSDATDMASGLAQGSTNRLEHFVTSTASSIAVPNLVSRGMTMAHDLKTGVVSPRESKPDPEANWHERMGKSFRQQALPGVAADFPLPVVDLYGEHVENRTSTVSDLAWRLVGVPREDVRTEDETGGRPYDRMIVEWNKRVHDEKIKRLDGSLDTYNPENWPLVYHDRRGAAHALDEAGSRELAELAGGELLRRLTTARARGMLNTESPSKKDIERFKTLKSAVGAWAEAKVARERR